MQTGEDYYVAPSIKFQTFDFMKKLEIYQQSTRNFWLICTLK